MKKYLYLQFLVLGGLLLYSGVSADNWYTVRWVDDGDSIVLQDGRHVRYIGINAPEIQHGDRPAEPFGYKAKSLNKKFVYQKKVRLEYDREKKDRYGRVLAYVYLRNGTFINAEMISQGAAYFLYLRPNTKYTELLIKQQQNAMRAGLGLWENWSESKSEYIGNQRSRRFHLPTCPFAKQIKAANKVRFYSKREAFWAGYAPAKRCVTQWWGR